MINYFISRKTKNSNFLLEHRSKKKKKDASVALPSTWLI